MGADGNYAGGRRRWPSLSWHRCVRRDPGLDRIGHLLCPTILRNRAPFISREGCASQRPRSRTAGDHAMMPIRPVRLAITTACAEVLVGCASMAPRYERPQSPVPSTFTAAPATASIAAPLAYLACPQVFIDPN